MKTSEQSNRGLFTRAVLMSVYTNTLSWDPEKWRISYPLLFEVVSNDWIVDGGKNFSDDVDEQEIEKWERNDSHYQGTPNGK